MPLEHLHQVYHVKLGRNGLERHLAGRFLTAGGHVHILEDYHGLLGGHLTEGPITLENLDQIRKLKESQYLDVVSQKELQSGKRSEYLPEAELNTSTPQRSSSFMYQHQGNSTADHVDFREGVPHFNGSPTSHAHINSLIANVKQGLATIRYRPDQTNEIAKMESWVGSLFKSDEENKASEAFSRLRELVESGHLDPEHERVLAGLVFKDALIPQIGNKFAFNDFLRRHAGGGVHLVMDANDFKSVNDTYGHSMGDSAIKAIGQAAREAMDETVGPEKSKLFRMGGDEFAAHVPTYEDAARFARSLRSKLDQIEPIAGQHRLSMSFGFGADHDSADKALYQAKKQKFSPETRELPDAQNEMKVRLYRRGQSPHFAHSFVPGFEGPLPLDSSQLNIAPPPAPEVKDAGEEVKQRAEAPQESRLSASV